MSMQTYFVGITTCERPDALWALMQQLSAQSYTHPIHVCVVDDASRRPLIERPEAQDLFRRHSWVYLTQRERLGKTGFWTTYGRLLFTFGERKDSCFVSLQDDCIISGSFFQVLDRVFGPWAAGTPPIPALNTHVDERNATGCWGTGKPKPAGRAVYLHDGSWLDLERIGWLDGFNAIQREALEAIGFRMEPIRRPWEQHPELGSGVGAQLSARLREASVPIYGLSRSLVKHTGSETSVMNPVARAEHPLETLRFLDDA